MPPGFEQVLPGSSGDGIKQPTITTKISNHQSDDTGESIKIDGFQC